MFMGIGNFGIFVRPMSEELGLGNSAFGWALSARLFGSRSPGPSSDGFSTAAVPACRSPWQGSCSAVRVSR